MSNEHKEEHQPDTIGHTRKIGRPRKRVRVVNEESNVRLVEEEEPEE